LHLLYVFVSNNCASCICQLQLINEDDDDDIAESPAMLCYAMP